MSRDSIQARNAYYKGQLAAKKVVSGKIDSISQYVTETLRESEEFSYWSKGAADEFSSVGRKVAIGVHPDGNIS